ncbi:MAG: serine/threonine-protein phosphatase [Bacteroidales bacterium]|nr:serine/threonine-protein phosphatase [Bacteroidales bacterium]
MKTTAISLIINLLVIMQTLSAVAQDNDGSDPNIQLVDSLLGLISPASPDTLKAHYYGEIARVTGNADTSLKYGLLAIELYDPSNLLPICTANYNVGKAYYMRNESEKALPYFAETAQMSNALGLRTKAATAYVAIGSCYEDLNIKDSIFLYYNMALKIYVEEKDTAKISYAYLTIGETQSNMGLYAAAEENYRQALHYVTLAADTLEMAYCNYMIGDAVFKNSDTLFARAITSLRTSVELFDSAETNDVYYIHGKYLAYSSLAGAYIAAAKFTGQQVYADSCYLYIQKVGKYDLNNGNIANYIGTRHVYVDYLIFCKRYKDALAELSDLQQYFTDDIPLNTLKNYHDRLCEVHKNLGNYKEALYNFEKSTECKFALLNDSTFASLKNAEVERTRMFEELKRENAEKLYHAAKTRFWIIIISLAIGLSLIFVMLWNKRAANRVLKAKNTILNEQKSEIEAQRDEIEAQRNQIESQRNDLISSVNYAKRIQFAAVSKQSEVDSVFPENFVYYRPRDIVSGDFFRVAMCGKYRVLITADCTGHGIPGAFLSMLGISALKEFCVSEHDAENPGTVLDRMRDFIKNTLVSGTDDTINDGMDMTICSFDFSAKVMRYATANQTILLIRNGKVSKLKGDHMPVGRYLVEKDHFQTLEQPIETDDMVYCFSDGIQDQTGGPEGNRMKSKQFFALLLKNSEKPVDQQYDLLDRAVSEWRGNEPQLDDMTLVGIRVG